MFNWLERVVRLFSFLLSEDGAVTVDWVVLTAAVVGLGLAVVSSLSTGVQGLASGINTSLSGASLQTLGTLGSDGSTLNPSRLPPRVPPRVPIMP